MSNGFPITYAVDGRQYVAVSTGRSLTSGAFNRLTPELRTPEQREHAVRLRTAGTVGGVPETSTSVQDAT